MKKIIFSLFVVFTVIILAVSCNQTLETPTNEEVAKEIPTFYSTFKTNASDRGSDQCCYKFSIILPEGCIQDPYLFISMGDINGTEGFCGQVYPTKTKNGVQTFEFTYCANGSGKFYLSTSNLKEGCTLAQVGFTQLPNTKILYTKHNFFNSYYSFNLNCGIYPGGGGGPIGIGN